MCILDVVIPVSKIDGGKDRDGERWGNRSGGRGREMCGRGRKIPSVLCGVSVIYSALLLLFRLVQQISSQWGVWCFLSLQRDATHLDHQSNGRPIYQLEIMT